MKKEKVKESKGNKVKKVKQVKLLNFLTYLPFLTLSLTLPFLNYVYAQSIVNTKHNLSAAGTGDIRAVAEQDVCVFCHTPHSALSVAPLWNHTLSNAVYQLYSSDTLLSPTSPAIQPDKSSKLCLSCHDGTVALGSVVNIGGAASTISMQQSGAAITALPQSSSSYLGTDISGHHPISIEVNADLITDKQTQCNEGAVTFKVCLPLANQPVKLLPTDNAYGASSPPRVGVQCASCHDPHRDPSPPVSLFLRVGDSNDTDQLCTTCHVDCLSVCP
ncbi:MAG: hypothetical protein HZC48_06240 [Nitrospirae bacterium]|nr:hypothetical protein [Nitrospirota bacterium]